MPAVWKLPWFGSSAELSGARVSNLMSCPANRAISYRLYLWDGTLVYQ